MRCFAKIAVLEFHSYPLYFRVLLLSFFVRLLVVFVSFEQISKWFKYRRGLYPSELSQITADISEMFLALERVAKYTPWRCKCLEQGIIAKLLLQRRNIPSTIIFGVHIQKGKIVAHAWLKCGSEIVIGGNGTELFKPIAFFS